MSDHTSNPVSFPIPHNPNDKRPLPEIIASHYRFPLAYHDVEGVRYYAVQDWIRGVARPADARLYWNSLKERLKKAQIEMQCCKLPYKAIDNKIYKREHAPAETLYVLLNMMSLKTGVVSDIRMGKPYQQGGVSKGFVYLITANELPDKYKIGRTRDIKLRISTLRTMVPVTFKILHLIECSDMKLEELRLHRKFQEQRVIGEWFALSAEDVAYIQSIKTA